MQSHQTSKSQLHVGSSGNYRISKSYALFTAVSRLTVMTLDDILQSERMGGSKGYQDLGGTNTGIGLAGNPLL